MRLYEEGQKLKLGINVLVLVVALYGVSTTEINGQRMSPFSQVMVNSFAPIQKSVVFLKRWAASIADDYLLNVNASIENRDLKNRVLSLKNQMFEYEELAKENIRIKELLKFGKDIPKVKVMAQIVGWDASSDFRVLRINKGSSDGIKLQSPVVTAVGVVGYIYRMTDHFSDILTILDANNRVDGIIERMRAHGTIEGDSSGRCIMKYVTRTQPIILNDIAITSGLGNTYPKGLRIGTVTRIERESYGITQYVEVTPAVDFSRLEEVVVLISEQNKTKNDEWNALEKGGNK